MNTQCSDLAVLARIEKLEKENARFKRIGAAIVILSGALLLMGQARQEWQNKVLRVGKVQANVIEILPEGAVYSNGFSPVPTVRISGDELTMYDSDGKPRVSLQGGGPLLQMGALESDNAGHVLLLKGSTVLLEGFGTGGALTLNDRDGKQTINLSTYTGSAGLALVSDAPRLSVVGAKHDATVIGRQEIVESGKTYKTSAAAVFLFDEKGNSIWSAERAGEFESATDYLNTQMESLKFDANNTKRKLEDFKEAVCSILQNARADEITRRRLTFACD